MEATIEPAKWPTFVETLPGTIFLKVPSPRRPVLCIGR